MPLPNDNELPFRLRQSTFRLYEPYIDKAIRTSATVAINPAPLRPTTFAARLRDAIVSYSKFRWPASFTELEFDDAQKLGILTVSHSEQVVHIGPKQKRGINPGQSLAFTNPNDKRLDGIFVDRAISAHELEAFAILLNGRLISGPVILTKIRPDDPLLTGLESSYDIALTSNSENHTILI